MEKIELEGCLGRLEERMMIIESELGKGNFNLAEMRIGIKRTAQRTYLDYMSYLDRLEDRSRYEGKVKKVRGVYNRIVEKLRE